MFYFTVTSVVFSAFNVPVSIARSLNSHVFLCTLESILIKESLCVCNANKLPLFGGVFSTPQSPRTTASLPYTFNVHCTSGCYALEAQVRRYKPHFHNALTIVRAAPDWPTLVMNKRSPDRLLSRLIDHASIRDRALIV